MATNVKKASPKGSDIFKRIKTSPKSQKKTQIKIQPIYQDNKKNNNRNNHTNEITRYDKYNFKNMQSKKSVTENVSPSNNTNNNPPNVADTLLYAINSAKTDSKREFFQLNPEIVKRNLADIEQQRTDSIPRKQRGEQPIEMKKKHGNMSKKEREEEKLIETQRLQQAAEKILSKKSPQNNSDTNINPKYIKTATNIAKKMDKEVWKPPIINTKYIKTATNIAQEIDKEVWKPPIINTNDQQKSLTVDTSSSQQLAEYIQQQPTFKPPIFDTISSQQPNINPQENQLIKTVTGEQKMHFNIPSKQKPILTPTIVKPKLTNIKIDDLSNLSREIFNDFPSITGNENNKRIVIQTIKNKLLKLNDMLESYEAKEHNMEIELGKDMSDKSVNDIKYILNKNFKILERLVKIIRKLMRDNFIFNKNVRILKNKINILQQNENNNIFSDNFKTINFYLNIVKEELNKPIMAYMTNSYVNIARIIDDANTHHDLIEFYLNKPNPNDNIGKLDLDVKEANLYSHIIVNNNTLRLLYDDVSESINKVATELERSKKEITIFLKDKEPNPIDAEIYNFKLLQIKNQLDTFMDILIHKKYMDYNINTKNNINRLETTPNEDSEMNKIDKYISSDDINGIKIFINNIDSNNKNKWKNYSIIYQKIYKIKNSNIRQDAKRHLFIRMPGWNDPKNYEGYEQPINLFYEIAEKTLDQSGEPSVDDIIIDILLNKKIQESLEGLRNIDVKLVKLFKQYGDQNNFDRLFKNLMLLQFNNFIGKMRIYCEGIYWGVFIDKFTDVFNEKMEQF